MDRLRRLGVDRVRLTASWSSLTRSPGARRRPSFRAADPAAYDQGRWSSLDTAVQAAANAGLRVMIDVGFWAPRWAGRGPGPRVRQDIDPSSFADFAVAVARRYSGSFAPASPASRPPAPGAGTQPAPGAGAPPTAGSDPSPLPGLPGQPSQPNLPGLPGLPGLPVNPRLHTRSAQAARVTAPLAPVDMVALWNEPNHQAFLLPQWRQDHGTPVPASPAVYREMVRAAYPAVKAARPNLTVVIGNTSSRGGLGGHGPVAPLRFLRELACVDANLHPIHRGSCAHFTPVPGDGWAHHPYSLTAPPDLSSSGIRSDDIYLGNLPRLARTLNRLVAAHRLTAGMRSIYLTEFGYETTPLRRRRNVSEARQAAYLTWGEYLASLVPSVRMFSQFLLRDQAPSATVQSDSPQRPHGQFYTGLERADGRPKLAFRSFRAGLFAQRTGTTSVLLFGRLRLGSEPRRVLVQSSRDGRRWTTRASARRGGRATRAFMASGDGSFVRYSRYRPGVRYRLEFGVEPGRWSTTLAVGPVPAPR